jgi:DNA-directed RNA polymerase sigma subunit (sigma70/sigma32)
MDESDDAEQEYESADEGDFTEEFADAEILALFAAELPRLLADLTSNERELLIGLYGLGGAEIITARKFAETHGTNHTKINRLHSRILERFKARLKHLQ